MSKFYYSVVVPTIFVLLWSSGYIFVKSGLRYCSPLLFLNLRFILASIILLGILAFKRQMVSVSLIELVQISITGILMQVIYLTFFFLAINHQVSLGTLAIILGVQPLLVAIISRDQLSRVQQYGLILGFLGLAVTVGNSIFSGIISVFGIVCALLSLLGITLGTIFQKKYCTRVPLGWRMLIQYLVSSLVSGFTLLIFENPHVRWSQNFAISLVWVAVVISVVAFFLYFALLKAGQATSVVSLLYCVPPVAAVLDYFIFHQRLTISNFIGMWLVVVSLFLLHSKNKKIILSR